MSAGAARRSTVPRRRASRHAEAQGVDGRSGCLELPGAVPSPGGVALSAIGQGSVDSSGVTRQVDTRPGSFHLVSLQFVLEIRPVVDSSGRRSMRDSTVRMRRGVRAILRASASVFSGNGRRARRSIGTTLLLILGSLWGLAVVSASPARGQHPGPPTERDRRIQYLTIQLLTYSPTLDERNRIRASALPAPFVKAKLKKLVVDDVIRRYGGKTGDGKGRRLGFAVGPLTLSHSDQELGQIVKQSFEIAEETGLAVAFHIDDSMFWERRTDLWRDPKNVEWLDWEGTPNSGRAIKWGGPPAKLAPQMCFNSPAITREIRRIAKEVIGAEIRRGVDRLEALGQGELFAAVFAGWETHIGQDFETERRLGYCALTNRGFGKQNPPKDPDVELVGVVQGFVELWTKALFDAGIAKERIYSHLPYFPPELEGRTPIPYLKFINFAPAYAAIGKYHRPGYSLHNLAGADDLKELYRLFQDKGVTRWAMAEGTAAGNEAMGWKGWEKKTRVHWESFLATRFNHGASVVNLFPVGLDTAEAVTAIRKFLRGEGLVATTLERHQAEEAQVDPACFTGCMGGGQRPDDCMRKCTRNPLE
jgi:hypothetical protein